MKNNVRYKGQEAEHLENSEMFICSCIDVAPYRRNSQKTLPSVTNIVSKDV